MHGEVSSSYFNRIRKFKPLSPDYELSCIREAQAGDVAMRDKVICHNLRFVVYLARRFYYLSGRFDIDDLVSEGNLGLITAIKNFNFSEGTSFRTLAAFWIRQKIQRFIEYNSHYVHVPIYLFTFRKMYRSIKTEFLDEVGRPPTTKELSEMMDISEHKVITVQQAEIEDVSFDMKVGEDRKTALIDLIAATEPDMRFADMDIEKMLGFLDNRQRYVLEKRLQQKTLKEIGDALDLSRERVRQIEERAIAWLKKQIKATDLKILYPGKSDTFNPVPI